MTTTTVAPTWDAFAEATDHWFATENRWHTTVADAVAHGYRSVDLVESGIGTAQARTIVERHQPAPGWGVAATVDPDPDDIPRDGWVTVVPTQPATRAVFCDLGLYWRAHHYKHPVHFSSRWLGIAGQGDSVTVAKIKARLFVENPTEAHHDPRVTAAYRTHLTDEQAEFVHALDFLAPVHLFVLGPVLHSDHSLGDGPVRAVQRWPARLFDTGRPS